MIGYRKNITQGSFWFVIATLCAFGVVRCHLTAKHQQTAITLAIEHQALAKQWIQDSLNFSQSKRFRSHRSGEAFTRKYNKPLNSKLALALLLQLRKTQPKNQPWQNSKDSAQLFESINKQLLKQNPFPHGIQINGMDSAQWEGLSGIGPATARKIVSYRNKLGGFVSTNQLYEITRIDTLLIDLLVIRCTIQNNKSQSGIKYLNINPDIKSLYRHPYVGPSRAKILLAFFQQHKEFSVEEWTLLQGIPTAEKEKISPYIMFKTHQN